MTTLTSPTPRAPRGSLRLILALLALAQLMFSLDIYIVFVALPDIGADLHFSEHALQWVVGAYTVFAGGFLLLGGRLADLMGRRRTFVAALVLYGASSLAGGLAHSAAAIVVARAVQGGGAALLLPSTLSLIGTLFEEGPLRNRALAVWSGAGASGLAVGALLGGALTQAFGWSAVFFVNVPLAAVVAAGALWAIPDDRPSREGRRFDVPGALTVTVGATSLVYVLVEGPVAGWGHLRVVVAAAVAVAMLAAFAAIERRGRDPLTPPRILANRSLVGAMVITFIYMGTYGALSYFLTVLLQTVRGTEPLQTGLAFLVPALATAAGTQLGERITTRVGARAALIGGFGAGAVGTAILALGFGADASYWALVPGLMVSGVAQGVTWTAMWIAAAAGVAPEEQGVASGMASMTLNVGNAVGLALLIAAAGSGVHGQVGDALKAATADGARLAVLLAAGAMVAGLLVSWWLPRARPASRPS